MTSTKPAVPVAVLTATLGLAAASWVVSIRQMNGMDMGVATPLGSFAFFVGLWVAMMAAMMLPGAAPAAFRRARASGWVGTGPLFVGSYLAVWTFVGPDALAAAAAEMLLERRELINTSRDHYRAGDKGPVRPVQRVHGDARG